MIERFTTEGGRRVSTIMHHPDTQRVDPPSLNTIKRMVRFINRSRVLLVGAAEAVGYVPKGTHHWEDFVTPEELEGLLADAGLTVTAKRGIAWRPGKGLHLSDDMALNYILSARRV
jgi:2-polyprenyl-3-methyl-5-hydroxy-6-metoxy-1,4-benzoquinol methylase